MRKDGAALRRLAPHALLPRKHGDKPTSSVKGRRASATSGGARQLRQLPTHGGATGSRRRASLVPEFWSGHNDAREPGTPSGHVLTELRRSIEMSQSLLNEAGGPGDERSGAAGAADDASSETARTATEFSEFDFADDEPDSDDGSTDVVEQMLGANLSDDGFAEFVHALNVDLRRQGLAAQCRRRATTLRDDVRHLERRVRARFAELRQLATLERRKVAAVAAALNSVVEADLNDIIATGYTREGELEMIDFTDLLMPFVVDFSQNPVAALETSFVAMANEGGDAAAGSGGAGGAGGRAAHSALPGSALAVPTAADEFRLRGLHLRPGYDGGARCAGRLLLKLAAWVASREARLAPGARQDGVQRTLATGTKEDAPERMSTLIETEFIRRDDVTTFVRIKRGATPGAAETAAAGATAAVGTAAFPRSGAPPPRAAFPSESGGNARTPVRLSAAELRAIDAFISSEPIQHPRIFNIDPRKFGIAVESEGSYRAFARHALIQQALRSKRRRLALAGTLAGGLSPISQPPPPAPYQPPDSDMRLAPLTGRSSSADTWDRSSDGLPSFDELVRLFRDMLRAEGEEGDAAAPADEARLFSATAVVEGENPEDALFLVDLERQEEAARAKRRDQVCCQLLEFCKCPKAAAVRRNLRVTEFWQLCHSTAAGPPSQEPVWVFRGRLVQPMK